MAMSYCRNIIIGDKMFFKKSNYDWLVVGLGNPGAKYENTRHNVGFMAVDLLMKENGGEFNKSKMQGVFGECKIGNNRIIVVKPQTFMNNSGVCVSQIAKFYKIPNDRIIVIFDDISLDVGKIRIREKGSHGGHNGMKSIISLLGNDNIARIKVGVGAKPHPEYDLADWVLSKFPKSDTTNLEKALDTSVKATLEIITRGISSAQNLYNS